MICARDIEIHFLSTPFEYVAGAASSCGVCGENQCADTEQHGLRLNDPVSKAAERGKNAALSGDV